MAQQIKITKPAVIVSIGTLTSPISIPALAKPEKLDGMSRPKIVLPSESKKARPEKTVKVPRVATNGKIPTTDTKNPLNKPPKNPY
jgi:hypothetical protein